MSQIKARPSGYATVTPSLVVNNSVHAIALYQKVFDATELELMRHQDRVVHAEIKIGDAIIMLADENKEWGLVSPTSLGGSASSLYLYLENMEEVHASALAHGFTEIMAPADMFWGDRFSQVKDPFGHLWSLACHQEDVDQAEIQRRMEEML